MKKSPASYFSCFISVLALSLCGVLGSVFCVTTAFGINVNGAYVVLSCVVCGTLLSFISLFGKKISVPLFALSGAAVAAALAFNFESFANGFRSSASFVLIRYNHFADWIIPFYDERELFYYSVSKENTCFFIFFAVILMLVLVPVIANDVNFIVPFSVTLPWLAMCLFILNTAPSAFAVCAILVFWITLIVTSILRHSGRDHGAYGILVTLPLMLVLSFVIIKAFPPDEYKRPDFVEKASESIIKFFNINNTVVIGPGGTETETSEGEFILDPGGNEDLRKTGNRNPSGREVMRVYTDYTGGSILIRGRSRGDFYGDVWYELPPAFLNDEKNLFSASGIYDTDVISLNALGSTNRYSYHTMTIELVDAETSVNYRPPFSHHVTDDYFDYFGFYVPYSDSDLTQTKVEDEYTKTEAEYASLVRRYFLKYDRISSIENAVHSMNGIYSTSSLNEKINAVTAYLNNKASYTLTPGKTPSSYNFVDYFLVKNKKGYCVHFATAATLMFRALGVPARYVTGFVASEENYDASKGYISVTDANAHAWVEVYCDGFGWIPVDVTPGYGAGYVPPEETSAPVESSEESSESEISEESSSAEESETSRVRPQPHTSSESPESSVETSSEVIGDTHGMGTGIKLLIISALLIVLALAGVIVNRSVRLAVRRRRFDDDDINKSALYVWKYASSVAKHGGKNDVRLYELAEKAKYSEHGIERDEYAEMLSRTEKCVKELYSSSGFFKKLKLRYIYAIE